VISPAWLGRLEALQHKVRAEGLYRTRRLLEGRQGVRVHMDGRALTNFSSNDYLGLAGDPRLEQALIEGAAKYGVGSGASHLICGHSAAHHRLEEELADFLGRDRALLFSTGYMANLGVLSALIGRNDLVFEDRLNHASLLDGAQLSGAKLKRYAHGAMPEVAAVQGPFSLIASDGVFSMDGDLMEGKSLASVASSAGAILMVDDAHGIGVLGQRGAGILEVQGLEQDEVPVLVGTLGKALGTFGAFVAGPEALIDFLIQKARTYIYTTAMPAAIAEATRTSLGLVQQESWRREHLKSLVSRFRAGAKTLGLVIGASDTPIQPIMVGDAQLAMSVQSRLLEAGFLVVAIRPPTVPKGTARLRCTLTAGHVAEDVDRLLEALSVCPELSQSNV
jgi:8-amino-7-oxononanoate synthase